MQGTVEVFKEKFWVLAVLRQVRGARDEADLKMKQRDFESLESSIGSEKDRSR